MVEHVRFIITGCNDISNVINQSTNSITVRKSFIDITIEITHLLRPLMCRRAVRFRLQTVSVPRTVAELDLSNNPILSPAADPRASLFVRMSTDESYARHVTSLNLSQIGLRAVPDAVPACKRLESLRIAQNRIPVNQSINLIFTVVSPK